MGMASVPEKAFAHWMTTLEAVAHLDSVFGSGSNSFTSKHTLLGRLRGAMVQGAAKTYARSDSQGRLAFQLIEPQTWTHVSETGIFWDTGDLIYRVHDRYGSTAELSYFDVRFEPDAVRAIAAPAAKSKSGNPTPPPSDELAEEIQKGPRVTDESLKVWYELYRKTYTGAADTEANALASAAGMFPGKSIARERVRALRGAQKRGRKDANG